MDDKKKGHALPGDDDTERESTAINEADMPGEGAEDQEVEDSGLILTFNKPYVFEGQEYTEVDLSGLENANGATLSSVGRALCKKMPGMNAATLEMTLEFAQYLAQRITKKPIEFFTRMPPKEAMKLKGIVVGFLYGGDGAN